MRGVLTCVKTLEHRSIDRVRQVEWEILIGIQCLDQHVT